MMTVHSHSKSRRNSLLLASIGAAAFTWVVVRAGEAGIAQQLKAIRVALPIVVVLSMARLLMQTLAWSAALQNEGIDVGLLRLVAIRMASQGMGYLTVFGPVLSEPMKINLLRTPVASTTTATILDTGVYWFTSALVAIAGCVSFSLIKTRGAVATLPLAIAFTLAVTFMVRRKPVLPAAAGALGKRAPSWLVKAAKIESAIREVRAQKPKLVARMFRLDLGCQLLLLSEVAVVVWSLQLSLHFTALLGIEGLTRGLKLMTGWVPARLGADEGGAMSAFAAFGFSPSVGLTLALTRRVRDLAWAMVGLTWLAWRARLIKKTEAEDQILLEGEALPCNSLS
jgi:hypothetical protein